MPRTANDVSDTAGNIIATISLNSGLIFERLRQRTKKLSAYASLLRDLPSTNVATDVRDYQKRYNGFYKVRFPQETWRVHYYGLLQAKKADRNISFSEVIRELHRLTHRIEQSFSSKLLATIRPELPVYDIELCGHMNVVKPLGYMSMEDRIRKWIVEYDRMIAVAGCVVQTPEFRKLSKTFDQEFPLHKGFTNTKKLDLMLWQCRENDGSGGNA